MTRLLLLAVTSAYVLFGRAFDLFPESKTRDITKDVKNTVEVVITDNLNKTPSEMKDVQASCKNGSCTYTRPRFRIFRR